MKMKYLKTKINIKLLGFRFFAIYEIKMLYMRF